MGYNREEYLRNKLIGERLAALRHYNNLTPGEFAKRICVSPNIVEPVELNTADMYSDSVLKLISLEFNVSLSWLLSGIAEPTDPKEIDNFNTSNSLTAIPSGVTNGLLQGILEQRNFTSKKQFEDDLKNKSSKKKNIHRSGPSL